ncbi:hypothetical protein [Halomontanus rarus]|uniref:hypothetical protein n=1 Tax=Halomontanus rarus TaxID=3034020 RepID=UPI001A985DDD
MIRVEFFAPLQALELITIRVNATQTTALKTDDDTDPLALLVVVATVALAESLDIDLNEYLPDSKQGFSRRKWGLTTGSDGTVNTDHDKDQSTNGG